jgi:hypothetical protein
MKKLAAAALTALFAVSAPAFAADAKKEEPKKADAKKAEPAKKDEKKKAKGGC